MQAVIDFARHHGWLVYHGWISIRSSPGWPDAVFVKPGQLVLYVEFKREGGKLTPAQAAWLDVLRQAKGTRVFVWSPSSWPDIERVLGHHSRLSSRKGAS
jgi:VRR-NUC domain